MKLSLRTSAAAAVLTMAATVGVTAGTVAPAAAASCTEIASTYGHSYKGTQSYFNYSLHIQPSLQTTGGNCSSFLYRHTVYIYNKSGTILAQKTATGYDSYGRVFFGVIGVTVPAGTDAIGVGFKTEYNNIYTGSGWSDREKRGWGVKVLATFDSSTNTNIVGGGSCSYSPQPGEQYPLGYSEWCRLPF